MPKNLGTAQEVSFSADPTIGQGVCKQLSSVVQLQGVSAMRSKILVVLIAVAVMGVSWTAMARGGGGGGGGKGGSGVSHFHGRFDNHFLRNHFLRNQAVLGGWGWDGGWGYGYGDNGYGNTTVVAFPQATPQAANVTGSIATGPCHWNADTFNVPSAAGGSRPVQVVSCR